MASISLTGKVKMVWLTNRLLVPSPSATKIMLIVKVYTVVFVSCILLVLGSFKRLPSYLEGRHLTGQSRFTYVFFEYIPNVYLISVSSTQLQTMMISPCCEKFENSIWPPLWRQKFFENWDGYHEEIPCGSKIWSKSLYLARFSRYKHFCVFLIWKIRND